MGGYGVGHYLVCVCTGGALAQRNWETRVVVVGVLSELGGTPRGCAIECARLAERVGSVAASLSARLVVWPSARSPSVGEGGRRLGGGGGGVCRPRSVAAGYLPPQRRRDRSSACRTVLVCGRAVTPWRPADVPPPRYTAGHRLTFGGRHGGCYHLLLCLVRGCACPFSPIAGWPHKAVGGRGRRQHCGTVLRNRTSSLGCEARAVSLLFRCCSRSSVLASRHM